MLQILRGRMLRLCYLNGLRLISNGIPLLPLLSQHILDDRKNQFCERFIFIASATYTFSFLFCHTTPSIVFSRIVVSD